MSKVRLDLHSKLFQRTIWPRVSSVAEGARSSAPLVVDLDPTSFCDLACPECISAKVLNQGRFTKDRLRDLSHEFADAGVRAVVLIGGGEPLAHPGTKEVIRVLGAAGVHVGLVTNGTMLDRYQDDLVEYGTWVRVSMDAATSETYGRVRPDKRGRSVFDKVVENMRSYAQVKRTTLGYSFLVITRRDEQGEIIESNHEEIFAAATLAKNIGCDYFEIKTMFNDDHYIVPLPASVMESIQAQVEAAMALRDDSFDLEFSSTLESVMQEQSRQQTKDYHTCKVAELRTLVTPTGVYMCSYHRGNEAALIGDAVEESFEELWRNANRESIDPSRDCKFHCARHSTNLELLSRPNPNASLVEDYDRFI